MRIAGQASLSRIFKNSFIGLSGNCRNKSKMVTTFENIIRSQIKLPGTTEEDQRRVFEDLYLPVYDYIKTTRRSSKTPLFVGLSAPQGCGKTTLVEVIRQLASLDDLVCVSMSLDDFYLTGADQDALAEQNQDNGLLKFRGNAGSHDIALLNKTIAELSSTSNGSVSIPRYDKSLRGGRGDRCANNEWTSIKGPVDIVLFEGWMLGFSPIVEDELSNHTAASSNRNLYAVNRHLSQYERLHHACDAWIVLALDNVDCVYRWRLEAEHKMIASGKSGLTDAQVSDFVARFMPAYQLYLGPMYANGPQRKTPDTPIMMITVDEERKPISTRFI